MAQDTVDLSSKSLKNLAMDGAALNDWFVLLLAEVDTSTDQITAVLFAIALKASTIMDHLSGVIGNR